MPRSTSKIAFISQENIDQHFKFCTVFQAVSRMKLSVTQTKTTFLLQLMPENK